MLKTDCREDYKDCETYGRIVTSCPGEANGDTAMCGWCPKYVKNYGEDVKKPEAVKKDDSDKYLDCALYDEPTSSCTGKEGIKMCLYCPKFKVYGGKITYQENPQRKVYNIDFDGTLTTGEYEDFPGANLEMILKTRKLYNQGNIIIIWSARLWEYAPTLAAWLIRYGIPFHGIVLGKGGSDYYIDDKAINTNDFLSQK